MSGISSGVARLLACSTLLACSLASAQAALPTKCPAGGCPIASFPAPQIDISKVLESKIAALESKSAAQQAKIAALEGNLTKLLTHTHDVNTSIQNFSTFYVKDSYGKERLVLQPLGSFGGTSGPAGQPKFK
ncbi:MAG: hypothetical protein ABL931_21615 [Usitatibacteraceae bacterium]